jgi:hypothetical protein
MFPSLQTRPCSSSHHLSCSTSAYQASSTTMRLPPLRLRWDPPSAGLPSSSHNPYATNNHIHNSEPKHHVQVQVPYSSSVPASSQIDRSTARVSEMNGSSACSHTVFVTSRGLQSYAREMMVKILQTSLLRPKFFSSATLERATKPSA